MSEYQKQGAGMALSNAVADAVERAGALTVMVQARRRLPSSGILFQPGLVLTADHTVEREESIQVGLPDGSLVAASLAGRDRGTDLAVLRLAEGAGAAAQPASQPDGTRIGHLVLAAGRPSGDGIQASLGMLTAIGSGLRTGRGAVIERYLITDAAPLPGFSGGPLVDLGGQVIGINTSGLVRGASLAIPIQAAFELGAILARSGHVRRGYLGIRSQPVALPGQAAAALQAAGLARERQVGLLVVGIEAAGPADGRLMVGDILVGLNGRPVSDHDDLLTYLAGDQVGQTAQVNVLRGGQLQPVDVQVGEKK